METAAAESPVDLEAIATRPARSSTAFGARTAAWFADQRNCRRLAAAACVAALWFLARRYEGIVEDAQVYIGRAMADLDPTGIGRDPMFVLDGQSNFSIFRLLARQLVGAFGAPAAAVTIAACGLAVWLAAMSHLAGCLARGRAAWAIMMFVAALPSRYGAYGNFRFAESLAEPRPFAEACVLLSVACLVRGRIGRACIALAGAALFHPIMALTGGVVLVAVLVLEDRRRLWLPIAAGGAVVTAASLGLPVVDRLFTGFDAHWRAVLDGRCRDLFPTLWPIQGWASVMTHTVTVVIARSFTRGRVRTVLTAAAIAAWLGIVVSTFFGDLFASILVTQLQVWRSLWILSVLAAAMLVVALLALCRREPIDQIVAALLTFAWLETGTAIALFASVSAFAAHVGRSKLAGSVRPATTTLVWAGVAIAALISNRSAVFDLDHAMSTGLLSVPICIAVFFWARRSGSGSLPLRWWSASVALALSASAATLSAFAWDGRTSERAAIDRGAAGDELRRLMVSRQGEILWLDGDLEAWTYAGRPNWSTIWQASGLVFSRPLAVMWAARAQDLVDDGLVDPLYRSPFLALMPGVTVEDPAQPDVARFCDRPNAPVWIVASMRRRPVLPVNRLAGVWPSSRPDGRRWGVYRCRA